MPDNDSVDIPVPEPVDSEGVSQMADPTAQFAALHDQNMAAMGTATSRFINDAATVSKAADYAYLQDKDLVSLSEAVGVREVASRVNPAGPAPSTPVAAA
jgi:hypothetical protein